jgi:hypothetical protein
MVLDQPQAELLTRTRFKRAHKLFEAWRQLGELQIAAVTQFTGNIFGYVARPSLGCIESNHAHRVSVLASKQVSNGGLKVGSLGISFAPDPAKPAQIIDQR